MEEILKVALTIGALIGVLKIIHEIVFSKIKRHREDYEFSKKFIKDLHNPDIHPFVIEKGCRALTGDLYSIPEIKKLFSFSQPTKALQARASSTNFVIFNEKNSSYEWSSETWVKYSFAGKAKKTITMLYFIFAFAGVYPHVLSAIDSPFAYSQSIALSIVLIFLSVLSLMKLLEIDDSIIFFELSEDEKTRSAD